MPRVNNCPLCNLPLFAKFCKRMDKEFGCKSAFGCATDAYMNCLTCPLAMAFSVKHLMDIKKLPLGESFRLCQRQSIDAVRAREIIRDLLRKNKGYYPKIKEEQEDDEDN